jgi:hypothetical protein
MGTTSKKEDLLVGDGMIFKDDTSMPQLLESNRTEFNKSMVISNPETDLPSLRAPISRDLSKSAPSLNQI